MQTVVDFLEQRAARNLPRILTQVARDPTSPAYGCADRNWWHYKIRDFPSVILQQAGLAIAAAARAPQYGPESEALNELARQTCVFWNTRAVRFGSFEEYYPLERGYPPLAFSTLSVASLCADGIVERAQIEPGLRAAVRQLLRRFEAQAANQQVAGIAALAVIRRFAPELVPQSAFQSLMNRTLDLQTPEGWFPEYDGPDLGYLSVTIDCLWDIHDATQEPRVMECLDTALNFIAWFVLGPTRGAGMHNSRNTDYLVPYGFARLACGEEQSAQLAQQVMSVLFREPAAGSHFLDAIDDRYWCHYIGHSVYRACNVLRQTGLRLPARASAQRTTARRAWKQSGHCLIEAAKGNGPSVLVSGKKGAIFSAIWDESTWAVDFGWTVCKDTKLAVSHWWSPDWRVEMSGEAVRSDGRLFPHREIISTPSRHALLRLASLILGSRLIGLLKKLVIFKNRPERLRLRRTVTVEGATIRVEDRFSGLTGGESIIRAPRSSKRHVASADSYQLEDLRLLSGVDQREERIESQNGLKIITSLTPRNTSPGD